MTKKSKPYRFYIYTSPLVVLAALAVFGLTKVERLQADAERLAATGQAAIRLLKEYAVGLREGDLERVLACYDEGYAKSGPGYWKESLRSDRDGVRVYDWKVEPSPLDKVSMGEQLALFLEPISTLDEVKFKLDAVEDIRAESMVVRGILQVRGTREHEAFESQATFRLRLRHSSGRNLPGRNDVGWAIADQKLLRGQTVTGQRRGFTDVAAISGLDFVARHNPLFETPEWAPKRFGIIKYGSAGVSTADYDGDGFYDYFFADGQSSRLYRNRGDGTFVDVTAEVGLPTDEPGIAVALFVDFDNDGDRDLYLGHFMRGSLLFRNEGSTFTEVTTQAGLDVNGPARPFVVTAAAADYDNDGDVDIYLGRYLDPRTELPDTLFYTRNGMGNTLLRNDGGLHFTDVTADAGVRDGGLTLGVTWGDVDDDGDVDLYVANDFGKNALLRNDGGEGHVTFTDIAAESDALDFGYGMSASFGDIDNDGDFDLYVSNVHSGQRWYGQAATLSQYLLTSVRQGTIFSDFGLYREIFGHAGADWRDYGERVVKGNSLLLNDGAGAFVDVAEKADANPFGWYWASSFLDYDNDGQLDVYAANGWISGETHDDL